jgi:hypothetical protein
VRRRAPAAASLLLLCVALAVAIEGAATGFPRALAVLGAVLLAAAVAWLGLRHGGGLRTLAGVVAGLLLAAAILAVILEGRPLQNTLIVVAMLAAVACARAAFTAHVKLPAATAPQRATVVFNPRSGGGKAERFHLAQEASKRGIDPVELHPGDDLEQLVHDALARGADGLAAAGGDGTQAVIAAIAAREGLPFACIPAGTRNHFALDLGVDRDDVVGALDAFAPGGGERVVDLAEVNGHVFVNNVSLGLYAEAVRRPGYREAKLRTLLDTVPGMTESPNLRWEGPPGLAVLVSNNQYRLGRAIGSATRPRLDTGLLGITVIGPGGWRQWTAETFEVQAGEPVPAGIDGESVLLEPPLRFRMLPGALRVRVAPQHPGASPSALVPPTPGRTLIELARIAVRGA